MISEPESALRPLRAVASDVEALRAGGARPSSVVRVARAAESTLRRVLRDDPTAPVELRLRALSPDDLPTDELLAELRRRDRIPLELAAAFHELDVAAARIGAGAEPDPRDFDTALAVADGVERHIGTAHEATLEDPVLSREAEAPIPHADDRTIVHPVPSEKKGNPWRWIAAALGIALVVAMAVWASRGSRGDVRRAEEELARGQTAQAELLLRRYVADHPDDRPARLRLAAIYREAGRRVDALRELRAGLVSRADDAGLNAELGHLLLDSRRPAEATRAFRRALDGDPASERAWIGLVRALRENGRNDQAEQVLARAPAPVRDLVPRVAPAPIPASMPDPSVVPPVR